MPVVLLLFPACLSLPEPGQEVTRADWKRFLVSYHGSEFESAGSAAQGAFGIFDPSIAKAPGEDRLWLVYSTVNPSRIWPSEHHHVVETRLAYSDDGGETFNGVGPAINEAKEEDDPEWLDALFGGNVTWQHEVASLVYVPEAPVAQRWRLYWHQYPLIDGRRRFEFGWIAVRAAAHPTELHAATPRKLFVASIYDDEADARHGMAEVKLHTIDSDLNRCLVFTEPGAFYHQGVLFLALHCADANFPHNGQIVLLQQAEPALPESNWEYAGMLLDNEVDGAGLNERITRIDFAGFSAPELFLHGDQTMLLVTPTMANTWPGYRGCIVFAVDLALPSVERESGRVIARAFQSGDARLHNGACGFVPGSTNRFLHGQVSPKRVDRFMLYQTEMKL